MTTGSTPSTSRKEFFNGAIPWFTPGDIGEAMYLDHSSRYITELALIDGKAKLFEAGMLMVTCIGDIGRVGILQQPASSNQQITALKFVHEIDPDFAYFWFSVNRHLLEKNANQAVVPILNNSRLKEIAFSHPPLVEQKRIAGMLKTADRLRRLRRYALELSEGFLQSVFLEMFGDLQDNHHNWKIANLGFVSDIPTGVTKGRNFAGKKTIFVPYLRVANVQDGYLDLSIIKEIEALPADIDRLRLKAGDVLMTEGGDFDKLGRGAVWEGQIEPCIHQNHVFRVRLDDNQVLPKYFAQVLLTPYAKGYFLKASKQTTNLATINKTQLRGFPLPIPPLCKQKEFIEHVKQRERLEAQQREAIRQADHLFDTLLHRAFRGEL